MVRKARKSPLGGGRGDLSQRVYEALRGEIVGGGFSPGDRLIEVDICEWLGVSRTPVRDALKRLQDNGLAVPAVGGSLQVVQYDASALHELYLAREILEVTAASEAARNASPSEIDALHGSLRRQQAVGADIEAFSQENRSFHELIYQCAHNRFLVRMLESLSASLSLLGPTAIINPEWIAHAVSQHEAIARAISDRDSSKAGECMRGHVRDGFERRLKRIAGDR